MLMALIWAILVGIFVGIGTANVWLGIAFGMTVFAILDVLMAISDNLQKILRDKNREQIRAQKTT